MTTSKRKPAKAEIYALIDPRDGAVRYIGKANDSAKRLKSHIRDARREARRTPVYAWIRKIVSMGMMPSFRVLETTDDWKEAERRHIAEARARGERLLNVADGGDEPFCPPEVRAANGRMSKGRRWIPQYPYVHQIKMRLGQHHREMKKHATAARVAAHSDKIARIHDDIERARASGRLGILDAAYGVYIEALRNGIPNKIAAEKARQANGL